MSPTLLTPEQVGRLGRLDLIARQVVEGFLVGLHRSPYHGFSVEFAEYRQYIPGEPAEHVDWRLFAKTDRHYVKVFAEETNLRAMLLVDASASMAYAGAPGRPTKFDYARMLAAALAYLLLRQNDAVGLELFADRPLAAVPPRAVRRQLFPVLARLERAEPAGGTAVAAALHRTAERSARRGLMLLLSDLHDDPVSVLDGLKHLRHRGHEVVVFHVLDPREIDLGFRHDVRLEDLERPGLSAEVTPAQVRGEYRRRVAAWRDELRRGCRRQGVDLVELTTDTPFDRALLAYLLKRRRLG